VQQRGLLKNNKMKHMIMLLVFCPLLSYGQNTYTKINLGVNLSIKGPGITLQASKVMRNPRFRISGNYYVKFTSPSSKDFNISQPVNSAKRNFAFNMISAMGEYLIIQSKKDMDMGLSFGLGPGYTYSTLNNNKYIIGPGIATKLAYEGILKNNWYWGVESFGTYYFNQHEVDKHGTEKLTLMPIIIKIGFMLHRTPVK